VDECWSSVRHSDVPAGIVTLSFFILRTTPVDLQSPQGFEGIRPAPSHAEHGLVIIMKPADMTCTPLPLHFLQVTGLESASAPEPLHVVHLWLALNEISLSQPCTASIKSRPNSTCVATTRA